MTIVTDSGEEVNIPISTVQETKSYILTDGSQFIAPSGRWAVEFDYDYSRSNSMRPPPILAREEDTNTTNIDSLELLVDSNHITDGKEALVHNNDSNEAITAENEQGERQASTSRASLSQVDDMVTTSATSPSRFETPGEEATQPLPYAESLAQLRELTNGEMDYASRAQKKRSPRSKPNITANPELASDVTGTSVTRAEEQSLAVNIDTSEGRHIPDPAVNGPLVASESAFAIPPQEIPDSDTAGADDKNSASETESEPEIHETGRKTATVTKSTQKIEPEVQSASKNLLPDPEVKSNSSQDEGPDRPRKRRRVVAAFAVPISEEAETTGSPSRKRVKKDKQDDTSASEVYKKPVIIKQKRSRRRIRSSSEQEHAGETNPDESDTIAATPGNLMASIRRSTRSASVDKPRKLPTKPKLVLSSSISDAKTYEKTMESLGAVIINNVVEADIFCVPEGEIKKTLKLVMASIHGKFIATESWLKECTRSETLTVDPMDYLPSNQGADTSWNLAEAIDRGRKRTTARLLESWTVYLSEQLTKELGASRVKEQKQIANAMGAKFYSRLPTKNARPKRLILGSRDDAYAGTVESSGHAFFQREMLTMVALRGELDMASDEFKIQPKIKVEDSD